MEQIIEASQATISQAVITIKAVRIGKKQMTQSVFNQLPEKDIWQDDCTLKGEVWGAVNYCKCIKEMPPHTHFLWEYNNVLYKSILRGLNVEFNNRMKPLNRSLATSYLGFIIRSNMINNLKLNAGLKSTQHRGYIKSNSWKGLEIDFTHDDMYWDIHANHNTNSDSAVDSMLMEIWLAAWEMVGTDNLDEIGEQLTEMRGGWEQHFSTFKKNYDKIKNLDQLFIAV